MRNIISTPGAINLESERRMVADRAALYNVFKSHGPVSDSFLLVLYYSRDRTVGFPRK